MCLCFFYDTSRHSVSIIKVHPLCIIHNFPSPFFFFYYIMQTTEYEFVSHIQLLFTLQRYEFFCKSQMVEVIAVVIKIRWSCNVLVILLC